MICIYSTEAEVLSALRCDGEKSVGVCMEGRGGGFSPSEQ